MQYEPACFNPQSIVQEIMICHLNNNKNKFSAVTIIKMHLNQLGKMRNWIKQFSYVYFIAYKMLQLADKQKHGNTMFKILSLFLSQKKNV